MRWKRSWRIPIARAVNRGDVNANFVLSMREDALSQLDRFETRIPNLMSNYLRLEHLDRAGAERAIRKRRFLFLGYGLRDWNLRVMLRHLKSALATTETSPTEATGDHENLRAWAIQRHPSELERALWLAHRVNIYDMDIDGFAATLRKKMGLRSPESACQ